MSTWPATLPNPMYGLGLDPKSKVLSTDMEVGLPRVRRRSSAKHDIYNVSWEFTDAQMTTFKTWFEDTIFDGSAWFTINLPDGGTGLNSISARFQGGQYSSQIDQGMMWTVTARLESM